MNFEIIETKHLFLKGITPEYMTFIFENNSKNEIKKLLGHHSDEDFEKELYKQKNGYSSYNRSFVLFLLVDKATQTIIGRCGLHNWNKDHRRAEVGYVMEREEYKRKGLMKEALSSILDYGFNQIKLNRIEALVGTGNIPSLKLMEHFNFRKEGVLKEHYLLSDEYVDSVMFSKLKSDLNT